MGYFIEVLWRVDYPLNLLILFLAFFIPSKKKKRFYIPLIIGLVILFGFWQLQTDVPLIRENVFLSMGIYIVELGFLLGLIYFTLDFGFESSLFIMIFIVASQHLSYKLALQLVNFIDIGLYNTSYYLLISYSFLILITIALYFAYTRNLNEFVSYANILSNSIALGIIILIALFFSLYQRKVMFIESEHRFLISTLFNFSNIIISIMVILFLYGFSVSQKRKQEALIVSLMASKERERYELAKITVDEINIKYHDLKHMLQDNTNNINEEDLKEIKETVTNYKAIIQTSNEGLNIVIYESQLKCIKLGIDLNVLIDGDVFKDFKPHHIYSLLSNLLDNAIEAVDKIEDKERRRISLKIRTVRESVIVSLENNYEKKPVLINGRPLTTKIDASNHGYGYISIKRIVDKYDGVLDYSLKDDKFVVTILFPKKDKN